MRFAECVVFDPLPIQTEATPNRLTQYRVTHILSASDWRGYSVCGAHPGETQLNKLQKHLAVCGYSTWVWSLEDTKLPTGISMLYLAVATPPRASAKALHDTLVSTAPPGLVWTSLVESVGRKTEIDDQRTTWRALTRVAT